MDVERPSEGDMLKVAQKVLGEEGGIQRLIQDVRGRVQRYQRDIKAAESEVERAKTKVTIVRTESRTWQEFLGVLENLSKSWGSDQVAVLPSRDRTQENPDPEKAVQKIDPETKERLDEGKLCMFKGKKAKKWCPTRLTKKTREAGGQYCAKHQRIVNGKDE